MGGEINGPERDALIARERFGPLIGEPHLLLLQYPDDLFFSEALLHIVFRDLMLTENSLSS